MKTILILGLGKFGTQVMDHLAKRKNVRLMVLDLDEKRVEKASKKVYFSAAGDLRDPRVLDEFVTNPEDVAAAVLSLGDESFEATILAAMKLREHGVPRIIIKGATDEHRQVIEAIDESRGRKRVFRVIIPEQDSAQRLGRELASDFVGADIPLAEGVGIMEVRAPEEFANKTLVELGLRANHRLTLVALRRVDEDGNPGPMEFPSTDSQLTVGMLLTVIGHTEDLQAFAERFGD